MRATLLASRVRRFIPPCRSHVHHWSRNNGRHLRGFGYRAFRATVARGTAAEKAGSKVTEKISEPTTAQLRALAVAVAIPMVGFGFADNFIMIIAGDVIDKNFAVVFGFSTMAAAGLGNLVSDIAGISLGEVIEGMATKLGIESPALSNAQYNLRNVRLVKGVAGAAGIAIGCIIGMVPLLFINDRKEVYFTDDQMELFQQYFHHVPPPIYFHMLSASGATWHTVEPGAVMVTEGKPLAKILLLHSGTASAYPSEYSIPAAKGDDDALFQYKARLPNQETNTHTDRGCIIGGTALLEDQVIGKPYPNRVVADTKTTYVSFELNLLQELMAEQPPIQAAIFQCLYMDMLKKAQSTAKALDSATQVSKKAREKIQMLKEGQLEQEYTVLMKAVLADGLVHPMEAQMVQQWRATNPHFPESTHLKVLDQLGWTDEEYRTGVRAEIALKELQDHQVPPGSDYETHRAAKTEALIEGRLRRGSTWGGPLTPAEGESKPYKVVYK